MILMEVRQYKDPSSPNFPVFKCLTESLYGVVSTATVYPILLSTLVLGVQLVLNQLSN